MKSSKWLKAVDGAFDDAADWSRGVIPGVANAAVLGAGDGAAYIVTASRDETVKSLRTAANATLSIIGGTFTAAGGTGKGVNAGTIDVGPSGAVVISGTFDNSGAIVLEANGSRLDFAGDTKLTGGGAVDMVNGGELGFASSFTLTNVDDTISGTGFFGNGTMSLVNGAAGVIDATGHLAARFVGTAVNDGILEATTATGFLEIDETAVDGSGGGSIVAGDGATVVLDGATIIGGTLKTSGSGVIETADVVQFDILDGRASPVSLDGNLVIAQEAILRVEGLISNAGAISFTAPRAETGGVVVFVGADCTLSGGGRISLGDSKGFIEGAGGATTLTNLDNVITGGGEIDGGSLSLVNGKAGVIDADLFGVSLTIDAGALALVNAGLLEASGGGRLIIPALKNTGIIEAYGGLVTVGGPVTGSGSAIVNDGALIFSSSFSQDVTFAGLTGFLKLAQSQAFGAHIAGFSKFGGTSLDLSDIAFIGPGEASFSGGKTSGVLTVSDGTSTARLRLTGDYRNIVFTASDDGGGGVIITASGPVLTNSWLNAVDGSFDTASDWSLGVTPGMGQTADLAADGGGAYTVTTSNDETVASLQTAANATLSIASGTFTATGGTGAGVNAGTIDIAGDNSFPVMFVCAGKLDNAGAVVLENPSDTLRLTADTRLTGGGAVTFDGGEIVGLSAAVTLTNVDNTISGSGRIGAASLTLVNQAAGVIDASGTSDLTIDTGASAVINAGLIEVTGFLATLRIGAVENDGVIEADNGVAVVSGPVTGSGSAVINGAILHFLSGFSQNVTFAGPMGALELDQSQGFGASITGFSKSGGTVLDLKDVGFTGAGEATFSGTKASGVLTVSDGTHAAHITLIGDYRHVVFTATDDFVGGVTISASNGPSRTLAGLIDAMATLGASPAAHAPMAPEPWREPWRPSLCRPHAALA